MRRWLIEGLKGCDAICGHRHHGNADQIVPDGSEPGSARINLARTQRDAFRKSGYDAVVMQTSDGLVSVITSKKFKS